MTVFINYSATVKNANTSSINNDNNIIDEEKLDNESTMSKKDMSFSGVKTINF